MKKLTMLIATGWLCLNFSLPACSQTPIKPLQVGDEAGNLPLQGLLNAPQRLQSTAAYQGKLLILDFWATWCTSCLRQFPELEKLQQQFQGKLAVLGVTNEPEAKIRKWYTLPAGKDFRFPTVTGDTLLAKLFPHHTVPHYVWIGSDGRVKAITGPEQLTAAHIANVLNSTSPVDLQIKKDLDLTKPLFLGDSYPADNPLLSYSILSKGLYEGLPSGGYFRRTNGVLHGRALTNRTLLELYDGAAMFLFEQLGEHYTAKRRVLELQQPGSGAALSGPVYNYDLIVPLERADSLWQDMLHDLNRITGYRGRVEPRLTACFVLTREPGKPAPETKGGSTRNTLFGKGASQLTNCPVSYLITRLDALPFLGAPIVDETGLSAKIDLVFPGKPLTLEQLCVQLQVQGLRLEKAKRRLNMLVLSDDPKAVP